MWTTVLQPLLAQCHKSLNVRSCGSTTRTAFGSTGALLMMPQLLVQMQVIRASVESVYTPLKDCEVFALQQISWFREIQSNSWLVILFHLDSRTVLWKYEDLIHSVHPLILLAIFYSQDLCTILHMSRLAVSQFLTRAITCLVLLQLSRAQRGGRRLRGGFESVQWRTTSRC